MMASHMMGSHWLHTSHSLQSLIKPSSTRSFFSSGISSTLFLVLPQRLENMLFLTPLHYFAHIQLIFTGASRPFPYASPPCFPLTFCWSLCLLCPFVLPQGNISHSSLVIYLLPSLALTTSTCTHTHKHTKVHFVSFCQSMFLPLPLSQRDIHRNRHISVYVCWTE